jgi:hypothetical protein
MSDKVIICVTLSPECRAAAKRFSDQVHAIAREQPGLLRRGQRGLFSATVEAAIRTALPLLQERAQREGVAFLLD